MKTSVLLSFALSALTINLAYANNIINKDPRQTDIDASSSIDKDLQSDLLRKQKLSTSNSAINNDVARLTGKELVENPAILENLFLEALITPNNKILPIYIKLYKLTPDPDLSLIEWADAILLRDQNLNDSVTAYRKLQSNFPENDFIRFQLAETLFYNQEYNASKTQFEKLRASKNVSSEDITVFDNYLQAINSKEDWNFSFGTSFLNDKNLSNAAKQGTKVILPNGNIISYSSPQQKGQGISAWLGANKQWSLSGGKYLAFDSNVASKYYWDNKSYNEINGHIGLGLGYSDARLNISFIPYIDRRWYAGGINSGKALKRYSSTYGSALSFSYWLNQSIKYSFLYDYGYEKYDRNAYSSQYDGSIHTLINSLTYIHSATQYWSLSLDANKKLAKDKSNAYDRLGSRLTWGQEWPLGLSTSLTFGIGKRNYKDITFFGPKQKNTEYSTSLSLWHKKIHFLGFTPRITFNYTKTDSNIPIYSYDKKQIFFNVGKSF
ncbi:hypothetical protein A6B43_02735 [Vespertiliibacter pulmonis]|uniref:Uncharacterized protein DUF560 n=1 Tax=Vespertiliibacter pulmonis TaxID=1443036 RepID=A0A3N4VGI0_9PAST|nr:surface lipoprotein assembly modifier [Vespertiliibacter pulmonis]QLB20525.1 hypothetical protein A6B43_02735 [Vespertiliibacter pulmonis]RPE80833.1 uncharacterized protein DUF560 [Vespertiliibacter pulmonis]